MKTKDIEPGGLYLTTGGNIREIISIDRHYATWRWVYIRPHAQVMAKIHRGMAKGLTYESKTCYIAPRIVCEVELFEDYWRPVS